MIDRFLAIAFIALASSPTFAQSPVQGTAPALKADTGIAIDTSLGRIVVALDRAHAPVTTANFLHYVDTHRYDGQFFYRAMHVPDQSGSDGGLIQGGITTDARKLFPPIAHEPTTKTGIHHVTGTISLASAGPGTGRADFFILVSDMPGLDAGGPGGDPNGFAAFGHVTDGMDVVRKIWASPVSATKGAGAMKGQMLDPPIKIVRVERVR